MMTVTPLGIASTRPRGCASACRAAHWAFSLDLGDRAFRTFDDALYAATQRAPKRGRQVIRRHVGTMLRSGVWLVQDVRP